MSELENILYSALEHGKRDELLREVGKIRKANPNMPLYDMYQLAYETVLKV